MSSSKPIVSRQPGRHIGEFTPSTDSNSSNQAALKLAADEHREAQSRSDQISTALSPQHASRWGVLRHRHYRLIFLSMFVSSIGGWMELIGIQLIVAHKTGSLKMMGYFAAAQLLPILILGTLGGLLTDRVNRKKLLITTQTLLMLIAALVAAASHWQSRLPQVNWRWMSLADTADARSASGFVAALFILSIAQGIVLAFNMPAWQVLTPRLVPRKELTAAITMNGIQFNAARVIGPALAGMILGLVGATPLFVINALTFLGVVIAVSLTPDDPAPPHDGKHPWKQVLDALSFLLRQRAPFAVFLAMVLMNLLAAPMLRMLPLYVIDVYDIPSNATAESVTGTLISVLGVGAVLGGLAMRHLPKWYPKHHFIPSAVFGTGITLTCFALTTHVLLGYAIMLILGVFWIWGFNPAWAAMQNLVKDNMRGRVMAMATVASFGATAIGNILAGLLGDAVSAHYGKAMGAHLTIGVPAAILFLAGILMLMFRIPEIDGQTRILAPGTKPSRNILKAIFAVHHRPSASTVFPREDQQTVEEHEPA